MTLPRRRRIVLFLLAFGTSFAVATGVALASFGPRRAARVARIVWRAKHGKASATDLAVLGRSAAGFGFAERLLEERLEHEDAKVRRCALLGLVRGFPENRFAQAVSQFEALTGERYFEGGWSKVAGTTTERGAARAIPLDVAIRRWRELIALCPDFPGRDDAGLHLARCEEEAGKARAAFFTLLAARQWGDQDARFTIEDRLACVLDAQLPFDETLELARIHQPHALLAYAAAVKLARAHRFEEAALWLDRVEKLTEEGDVELLGHSPRYFIWRDPQGNEVGRKGTFVGEACQQRALWRKLGRLEKRGARLEVAGRLLAEPHAFTNLILNDSVHSDRAGVPLERPDGSRDERFRAYLRERSNLAQAAAIFEDVARTDSSSRDRALLGAAVARVRLVAAETDDTFTARVEKAGRAIAAALNAASVADAPLVFAMLAHELDSVGDERLVWQNTKPEHITVVILRALRSGPETFSGELGAQPREPEERDHGR